MCASQLQPKDEQMKIGPRIALTTGLYLAIASCAFAQASPDPSRWICRNLSDSGGFVNQGESIFGSQVCTPKPQAAPQTSPAPAVATASPQVRQPVVVAN